MRRLSFFGKQVLFYSLLMTAAVLILILWANAHIMDVSRENAVIVQEQFTRSTLEQVDHYLDHLRLIAAQVAHDTVIIHIMEALKAVDHPLGENYFETNEYVRAPIARILSAHNQVTDPVYRIELYNTAGDYICTDFTADLLQKGARFVSSERNQSFLQDAFLRDARTFIMMGPYLDLDYPDPMYQDCVYMMMPVKNHEETEIYGYVTVYQPIDALHDQLDLDKRTGIDVYLYSERDQTRGRQIYPTDQLFPDTSSGNYHETELQSDYDWFVVLLQNQKEFLAPYRDMLLYLCLSGAALLLMLFLCVYFLARYTSRPILELSRKVRSVALDHVPSRQVAQQATNEVKQLEDSFDAMVQRLKASVELERTAYLNALQAQMNPHFLYNCLSTISSMSVPPYHTQIPEFCTRLASILRYESTYTEKAGILADELKNAQDYLELMKLRYEEDFTYEMETDERLLHLPMPHLVLQPILENCFEHGFRTAAPPWHIQIRIFQEQRQWCITIADNGNGFDDAAHQTFQERVDSLMARLSKNYSELKIGGMGLVNTIVRMRLATNDQLYYSIAPNDPAGTIVTLKGALDDL